MRLHSHNANFLSLMTNCINTSKYKNNLIVCEMGVGKMGVGEMGVGKTGVGEMGAGKTGTLPSNLATIFLVVRRKLQ